MSHSNNWQPTASLDTLKRRAQLLADVRRFFMQREVLEVDTPILSTAAPTAPYLDSFATQFQLAGMADKTAYLQTSPEFAMKRLLAAGYGDIYQIAKVFRNAEQGSHHSPEFTMMEWYRPSLDYRQLMQEVDDLLQQVAGLNQAVYFSYRQVFEQYLTINPHTAELASLKALALDKVAGLSADWELSKDDWLELVMSQYIEPNLAKLNQPVVVYDFPASQAQLAKVYQDESGQAVAARFEVYVGGLELANGYDELLDANELRTRFEQDNQQRQQQNKPLMPIDEHLLAALEAGMPACTGVALGLDRLLMLIQKQTDIRQVQSFSLN